MDQGRCLTCRHWSPPPATTKRRNRAKAGHCGLDGELAHAGYTCERYQSSTAALLRNVGISETELAWLQAHPDDVETQWLRTALRRIRAGQGDPTAFTAFQALLKTWRATARGEIAAE